MIGPRFRALACLTFLAAVALAQPGKDGNKEAPLPPGTVVAITDNVAKALEMVPKAWVLSADEYQRLLAELARLGKLAEAPRFFAPSKCLIKGKADGGLLLLQAVFDFDAPVGSFIRLGCGPGLATAANLDGRTPALLADVKAGKDAPGFVVQSDKAGPQQLTLELMVPLLPRPGGQGFILDLPRAAITAVDLELPTGGRDPRLAGKALDAGLSFKGQKLSGPLGPISRLDLSWRSPATAAATAVTAAEGVISVRAESRETVTEAKLDLKVLGGQVKTWQLLVPKGAELSADKASIDRIDMLDQKGHSLRTIHLKEATADPLTVNIRSTVTTPRPGAGKPALIGPFNVVGAVRQSGTILVSGAAPELHLELKPRGDLTRRGLTEEERKRDPSIAAAFRYGPSAASGPGWMELETEAVQGQIKARPSHVLKLVDGEGGPAWMVETTLDVTPRWSDVDRLAVTLPPGCEWEPDAGQPLPARVRPPTFDRTTRTLEFRLERGAEAAAPFTVRFTARLNGPVGNALPLPRPAGVLDQEGTISIVGPSNVELVPGDNPANLELGRQAPHELSYRFTGRHPVSVAVSWRPYRAPVEVSAIVSLTLGPGEGRIRHEFVYSFPTAESPRIVRLQLPEGLAGLSIRQGDARIEGSRLSFMPPARGGTLVIEYGFALPDRRIVEVPLARPEGASRVETKARIWGESGRLPVLDCRWKEIPIEEAPGVPRLPFLVASAVESDGPLRLRFAEGGLATPLLVGRALARVDVDESEARAFRISYRIERLAVAHADLELPSSPALINFRASLDGRRIDHEQLPDPRTVRLRLSPALVSKPAVLELSYLLPPGGGRGVWMPLGMPRLIDGPPPFPIRWQITAPHSWVLLGPEPGSAMPRVWVRSGWLLAPRCSISGSDLERWFVGDESATSDAEPSLVLWQDGAAEVSLARLPRQGWLLGCSLLLCTAVLGLARLASNERSGWAWSIGIVLIVGAVALAALWPALASQVAFGCQPGLAVLLVVGLFMWLAHERRRRQLVFLPTFARVRPGSSLNRREPPSKPPSKPSEQQPSTVDAPRALGSGLERLGG